MQSKEDTISELMLPGKILRMVDEGNSVCKTRDTVFYVPSRRAILLDDQELQLSLRKRFRAKGTVHVSPNFSELVLWCLSTMTYAVSEKGFMRIDNGDVYICWQFIDTACVSSSPTLRQMMCSFRGDRSPEGFRMTHLGGQVSVRDRPLSKS